MNGLHGIIFTYRRAPELCELAEHRTVSSVPFAGRYRVIDFMLSSMKSAGISDVGIIMQGNYQSLLDHLGSGKVWDMSRKYGGLKLLPVLSQGEAFRGRMEALWSVRSYLKEIRQDYVVLADGDLVANIPLGDVLNAHIASGADITAVCTTHPLREEGTAYFCLDETGRITKTLLSPREPEGFRSLEIYILSRELLLRLVDEAAAQDRFAFRSGVLCTGAQELTLRGYVWDGYAAKLHSVREYYERSMEQLRPEIRAELFTPQRPVFAKEEDEGASYIAPESECRNSLIADGCTVEGTVENSILFPGVHVGRGAEVRSCILFKNTTVGEGVILEHVITDKRVTIRSGRTLVGHETYPITIGKGSVI